MRIKDRVSTTIIYLLLVLWTVIVLIPIGWVLFQSLKTNQEFFQSVNGFPKAVQLRNYAKAWERLSIFTYMKNTLVVLAVSLGVTTIMVSMCSYVLARFRFRLSSFIFWFITFSMMLPGINAIIIQYIMLRNMGLVNTTTGLCLYFIAALIPFSVFLLTGFMQTIPREMEEVASIDGSSYTRTFFVIILPLCKSGLIAVNIFNFLGVYNSYIGPLLFISDPQKYPIAVGLTYMYILTQYKADWVTLFAGVMISIVPVILFYSLFQKQLISGTTTGALKG